MKNQSSHPIGAGTQARLWNSWSISVSLVHAKHEVPCWLTSWRNLDQECQLCFWDLLESLRLRPWGLGKIRIDIESLRNERESPFTTRACHLPRDRWVPKMVMRRRHWYHRSEHPTDFLFHVEIFPRLVGKRDRMWSIGQVPEICWTFKKFAFEILYLYRTLASASPSLSVWRKPRQPWRSPARTTRYKTHEEMPVAWPAGKHQNCEVFDWERLRKFTNIPLSSYDNDQMRWIRIKSKLCSTWFWYEHLFFRWRWLFNFQRVGRECETSCPKNPRDGIYLVKYYDNILT